MPTNLLNDNAFKIRDINLATEGRHHIRLAQAEMPGLMSLREEHKAAQPLKGARISGSLSMTVQTAVLIETFVALGAKVRWASCNIFSTQDEAAAAIVVGSGTPEAPAGVPVFAWKGQTSEEYWSCLERTLDWSAEAAGEALAGGASGAAYTGPNMLLDDGGDLIFLVHQGVVFEKNDQLPQQASWTNHEHEIVRSLLQASKDADPKRFTNLAPDIIGASEETTTGVQRLRELAAENQLLFPVINVNDSATKSKFDNKYGIRHSLVDGLNRATDLLIGGKVAFVAGYGDVGKGSAEALRGQGARVIISEIDPICALQAALDGYQVAQIEDVVETVDFFVTATGNVNVITPDHIAKMKNLAVLSNVGHFDNEIDVLGLAATPGVTKVNIRPLVDEYVMPSGRSVLVLSEGRVMNLGNATGHPSFVMSASFSNQVLAQIEAYQNAAELGIGVHTLPRILDEKVARLHLAALGVKLTDLTAEQAKYVGLPVDGPYKTDLYRY